MKCISWNVNGLRACMGKGFADIFAAENADIFCLQETKLQAGPNRIRTPRLPPILELRRKERLQRHGCFLQTGAAVRILRPRYRGAR